MSDDKQDDFLSQMATSTEADDTEAGETPDADTSGEASAETGEPAKPDDAAPPAADTGKKDSEHVPLAALKAEREKRQAVERELAELRNQQRPQAPAEGAQPQREPGFYDDPEAFVQRTVTRAQRLAEQRLFAALEADAREQYADFDEVMEATVARVKDNPALQQQIFSSANPARAAYRLGKQLRDAEALQKDPEAERERIRAEERAKLEAEFKAKEDERRKKLDAIPPDLAATRSTSGAFVPAAGGVFDEIFKET